MTLGILRGEFGIVLPKTSWTHTTFPSLLWQNLQPTCLLHLKEQMPELYRMAADRILLHPYLVMNVNPLSPDSLLPTLSLVSRKKPDFNLCPYTREVWAVHAEALPTFCIYAKIL